MKRREFLGLNIPSMLLMPVQAIAAARSQMAFNTGATDIVEDSFSTADEIPSQDIDITVPSYVEDGSIVQIAVNSHIPNTEAIAIQVEKNPGTLIGNYLFSHGIQAKMMTRIKMAKTSEIKVIVKAGHRYYAASKKVTVVADGYGATHKANEKFGSSVKIRAKQVAGATQVRAMIPHPMHTGYGKDNAGQLIPAHFIQHIAVEHNNRSVVEVQLGTGVAKNPYLAFHLAAAKRGDRVIVRWYDNLGNTNSAETKVVA